MNEQQVRAKVEAKFGDLPQEIWEAISGCVLDLVEIDFDQTGYTQKHVEDIIARAGEFAQRLATAPPHGYTPRQPRSERLLSKIEDSKEWQVRNKLMIELVADTVQAWRSMSLGRGVFKNMVEAQNFLDEDSQAQLAAKNAAKYLYEICGWEESAGLEYLLTGKEPGPAPLFARIIEHDNELLVETSKRLLELGSTSTNAFLSSLQELT